MCRALILFFLTLALAAEASAQIRIAGRVIDFDETPVEYVNVGIPGSTVGVVSDGQGRFSIRVPDSLAGRSLLFSHLSYGPRSVPVAELAGRGDAVIRLPESDYRVPEVVIRPGRARYRRLGEGRVRLPLPPGSTYFGFSAKGDSLAETDVPLPTRSSREVGTALRVREPLLIEEVSFPVESCPDSVVLRINLYQIEPIRGDTLFTPLHNVPFYILIPPTRNNYTYRIDVSDVPIVARPGTILVSFEQVYAYWINIGMPFYLGGETYYRNSFNFEFERLPGPLHIGFQVYGRLLPEE